MADQTENKSTLVQDLVDGLTAPLGITKTQEETISARAGALAAIGYFIGGVVVGDRWGDRIPLIGGRRA